MLDGLKAEVVRQAKAAERQGLCQHRSGNFSARDPETGYVCITPTGLDRQQMKPEDIVVMDMEARVVEAVSARRPTSEALMHLRAYRERPELMGIAHTHSRFATVFAILGRPIPAILYEMMHLGCPEGKIPVAPYARPGTAALADSIAAPLRESAVVLLASHGVLALGATLAEALLRASYTEELAEIYYRTLTVSGGQEPPLLPDGELQKWSYPQEIVLLPGEDR